MAKIFTTVIRKIRRVISGGGGGSGFVASVVKAGISITHRFGLTAAEIKPGVSVEAGRVEFRGPTQVIGVSTAPLGVSGDVARPQAVAGIQVAPSLRSAAVAVQSAAIAVAQSLRSLRPAQQSPAVAVSLNGVNGTLVQQQAKPALACSVRISEFKSPQKPACEIVQIKYDLTRRVGANSVTETAIGGRTDWINDSNAPGFHNSANATFTGNVAGARGGQLELSYADAVSKSELSITSAKLHFYGSVAGTVLNNADVQLKYDVGAGFVTLETITGNADFSVTPKTHDISAALNTWAKHDALRSAVSASSALGETWTAALDAVELELLATRTDTL